MQERQLSRLTVQLAQWKQNNHSNSTTHSYCWYLTIKWASHQLRQAAAQPDSQFIGVWRPEEGRVLILCHTANFQVLKCVSTATQKSQVLQWDLSNVLFFTTERVQFKTLTFYNMHKENILHLKPLKKLSLSVLKCCIFAIHNVHWMYILSKAT